MAELKEGDFNAESTEAEKERAQRQRKHRTRRALRQERRNPVK